MRCGAHSYLQEFWVKGHALPGLEVFFEIDLIQAFKLNVLEVKNLKGAAEDKKVMAAFIDELEGREESTRNELRPDNTLKDLRLVRTDNHFNVAGTSIAEKAIG